MPLDKVETIGHKPRRFHWYIRQKVPDKCDCEPSTSNIEANHTREHRNSDSMQEELSDYRFCGGEVSAKSLSNMILIALIQEITCGLIFATREFQWYKDVQLLVLTACRIIQIGPCFAALLGNYRNQAALVIPFMISQTIFGSYADIASYLLLVSDWKSQNEDSFLFMSPLIYVAAPILVYTLLLVLVLYIQYKSIRFVSIKKLSLTKSSGGDTLVESLM